MIELERVITQQKTDESLKNIKVSADDKDICTWRIEVKNLPSYGGKTLVFNCVLG